MQKLRHDKRRFSRNKDRRRKVRDDQQLFLLSNKLAMLDLFSIRQRGTKEACAPGYHALLLQIVAAWFHVSLMHCCSHAFIVSENMLPIFLLKRNLFLYFKERSVLGLSNLEKSLFSLRFLSVSLYFIVSVCLSVSICSIRISK